MIAKFIFGCKLLLALNGCEHPLAVQPEYPLFDYPLHQYVIGEHNSWGVENSDNCQGCDRRVRALPAPELQLTSPVASNVPHRLSSLDRPSVNSSLPFGTWQAHVKQLHVDAIEISLDGNALDVSKAIQFDDGWALNVKPAPGKHTLRARYLQAKRWSEFSHPISFTIRWPAPPEIIAAGEGYLQPLQHGPIKVSSNLAIEVIKGPGELVAFLDGEPLQDVQSIKGSETQRNSKPEFDLSQQLPGKYSFSVARKIQGRLTAQSKPIVVAIYRGFNSDEPANSAILCRKVSKLPKCTHCNTSKNIGSNPPYATAESKSCSCNKQNFKSSEDPIDGPSVSSPNKKATAGTSLNPPISPTEQTEDLKGNIEDSDESAPADPSTFPNSNLSNPTKGISQASFSRQSQPLPLPQTPTLATPPLKGTAAQSSQENTAPPEDQEKNKQVFYFTSPAHFPLNSYSAYGKSSERMGALIYENMEFSFDPKTGCYNVCFQAETPDTPVTLRLQLQFQIDDHWHTITLKPIVIPSKSNREDQSEVTSCSREGYSPLLENTNIEIQDIRRKGSARFGFGRQGLGSSLER